MGRTLVSFSNDQDFIPVKKKEENLLTIPNRILAQNDSGTSLQTERKIGFRVLQTAHVVDPLKIGKILLPSVQNCVIKHPSQPLCTHLLFEYCRPSAK